MILLLVCAFLFLSGNWILPLVDRDEPRFSEASREMLERGDYVIPRFNNVHRYDKPPLIYWCQIACYRVLGENEFAARLPTAVFALATVFVVFRFGRRLAGPRTGFNAALMLATCLQMLVHGRLAVADMPMICFVTLAAWAAWELAREPAKHPWWWIFWFSLALGFLAKGPVAWLPLLGALLWPSYRGRRISVLRPQWGVLLVLVVVGLWGMPALSQSDGDFFRVGIGKHVVNRSLAVMEGHGAKDWIGYVATLPLFFLTFFPSFFPWSVWSVKPITTAWRERRNDADGGYLFIQAALFFLVFTLSRTKLPHYTLPAFPFVALIVARAFANRPEVAGRRIRIWATGMVLFTAALTLGFFPWLKPRIATRALVDAVRHELAPDTALGSVDYHEPSVVWEFRGLVDSHMMSVDVDTAGEFFRTNDSAILIGRWETLSAVDTNLVDNLRVFDVSGINLAKGKPVELRALLKRGDTP